MTAMRARRGKSKRLFSFAVIADSHVNQGEEKSNSPFAVNRLANRRLRHVIHDLNQRDVVAVFHLGDVVHPVPSLGESYADSARLFFGQMRRLRHPLHLIPGNHDVGDKKIAWGPAGTVRESFLNAWTTHFGAHYFHIRYGRAGYDDLEFFGINAQLVGSGLDMEAQQRDWLEERLIGLQGRRLVLLSHYPPFIESPQEQEHYDNLGHDGRRWLLKLIERHRVEALFAGHVHHFWYNRFAGCDCYLLPSTAFVRQDYSEMFRVSPAAEYGRNDTGKLGYFLVHVYEDGHDFEMVRSFGIERPETRGNATGGGVPSRIDTVNARTNRAPVLGFDLRHDWAERVQIPPTGSLDEFDRKWVRNDYALLALWEMGVRRLRVPVRDVTDGERRMRVEQLHHLGFEFTTWTFGLPDDNDIPILESRGPALAGIEIVWPFDRIDELDLSGLETLKNAGVSIRFSPLRSRSDIAGSGRKYYHVINHGLRSEDFQRPELEDRLTDRGSAFTGWVFRAALEDDVFGVVREVSAIDAARGTESVVHLRLAADNPATAPGDEHPACNRLATAMFCAWAVRGPGIFCDTLSDNDRGYFPRAGVVDRLFNPRPAFHVVKNLHAVLGGLCDGVSGNASLKRVAHGLALHDGARRIDLVTSPANYRRRAGASVVDLLTGERLDADEVKRAAAGFPSGGLYAVLDGF